MIHAPADRSLGAYVARRTDYDAGVGRDRERQRRVVREARKNPRHPEIEHFKHLRTVVVVVQKEIVGLDVAVDDPERVRSGQR